MLAGQPFERLYLIAHAGIAAMHHFARSAPLSRMWRLKP